ncbi:MAG: hypothetical protein JKY94_00920 [Rhodobacteraceae bacterium]|nr:hypothetical protein [Paracoccaceae bacterium]
MCEPVTIAAGVMALAGTAMQMKAQSDATKQRAGAVNSEIFRQTELENSSRSLLDKSIADFTPEDGIVADIESRGEALGKRFVDIQTDPALTPVGALFSRDAPKIIQDFEDSERADALAFTSQQGLARGNLNSLADLLLDTGLKSSDRALAIDANRSKARGSLDVLGLEIGSANLAAASPLGDALSGLGFAGLGAGTGAGGKTAVGSVVKGGSAKAGGGLLVNQTPLF